MVLKAIDYHPASVGQKASLQILDQLQLPHTTLYISILGCQDGFHAIRDMKVRGAPAIAIVAALSLAVELNRSKALSTDPHVACQQIIDKLTYLQTSRPTAVNLGDAVFKLSRVVTDAARTADATAGFVIEKYMEAAELMLVHDVEDNKAIGAHGAHWIIDNTEVGKARQVDGAQPLKILTICNTGSLATAGYGTALGVIRSLHEKRHLSQAYACETRPYNQGSRLTAYELVHDAIPATLITDSMAAALLAKEGSNIAAVVVGADRVAANGDTANKIGTYSLAVLARYHGVKFLVAAPRTTIDRSTASGNDIFIEQRAANEVTRIRGEQIMFDGTRGEAATISVAADGIDVWNPAFDVTPHDLIDGVVTEVGVVEKKQGRFDFGPIFATMTEKDEETRATTIGGV